MINSYWDNILAELVAEEDEKFFETCRLVLKLNPNAFLNKSEEASPPSVDKV